jgi:hypothetical protein
MNETTIRVAIRATARISFVLFLSAFLGDALYRLIPLVFNALLNRATPLGKRATVLHSCCYLHHCYLFRQAQ